MYFCVSKVLHFDSQDALAVCTAAGDPHFKSFDGVDYSQYDEGIFTYAVSTGGLPFEVCDRNATTIAIEWLLLFIQSVGEGHQR